MIDPASPRLYTYHRALREAAAAGESTITSQGLAALLGHTISSTQIRKDLAALGAVGRRGCGYAINPLVEQLAFVLGLEHEWRIAIAGFGFLGHALATFITSRESRFHITAIFDNSPAVIGQDWNGLTVADITTLEHHVRSDDCNIGVIAVPATAASAIAQRMASSGIRAILNFAPATLHLRTPVLVRNIDLAGELSMLTHWLTADDTQAQERA
ncbi:MAG TPA: redox-sensing transcriptional repressor Rex [Candidatus Aquilonibacter sp.]